MLSAIVSAVWAAAPGLITGIVLAAFSRRQKRRDDAAEERRQEYQQKEIIKLNLLVASAELTRATAVAVKYGHTNGEMTEGLRRYNEAIEQFREYEREQLIS